MKNLQFSLPKTEVEFEQITTGRFVGAPRIKTDSLLLQR